MECRIGSQLKLSEGPRFNPDMTDTQIRMDNHQLSEVSHVQEKALVA